MAGSRFIPQPAVTIAQQHMHMQQRFPSFRFDRRKSCWLGTLKPTLASPSYCAEISYRMGKSPKVHLVEPRVNPKSPHLYDDLSLCLYLPRDRSWHPGCLLVDTIVPWTAEWLLFYEYWQIHDEWIGEAAPHGVQPYRKQIKQGI